MAGKNRLMARLVAASATVTPDSDYIATNLIKTQPQAVGLSVYSSIDSLPTSAATGTKAFVTSNNTLYFYNSGWYKIAIINSFNPQWITQPNGTYNLAVNGTATSITVLASDSDDVSITYIATPDSDFLLFATVTHDSDKDNTWIIQPVDSENGTAVAGTGTITFKASDGVNLVSAVSTFSLSFGPDWSVTPTESILTSPDNVVNGSYGHSTAISGDGNYALITAKGERVEANSANGAGQGHIYVRSGSSWTYQATVAASDAQYNDQMGYSSSMSDNGVYCVIGAWREDTGGSDSGAAYVFSRSGSTWTQQAKLVASDAAANDYFGYSCSISGDGNYIAIGAPQESSADGAIYIYSRSGSTWTQDQKITFSGANRLGDFQGVSLNSDGSYLAIGSYNSNSKRGQFYVWTRSGSTWTQQQGPILASDATNGDNFGQSIQISPDSNYIVVGAPEEESGGTNAGAAYIFSRSGSTWTQQAKIISSDIQAEDRFGEGVCIDNNGSYVVIGASRESGGAGDPITYAGAAYIFKRDGSTWTQIRKLASTTYTDTQFFGYFHSISISNDGKFITCGAYQTDISGLSAGGAAYIYEAG